MIDQVSFNTLYKLCAFVVRHIPILSEDESQWNEHPHWEWGRTSPGMHILTKTGEVPHQECISSLGMLTLTGNGGVPHWECLSSPAMGMCLTGSEHPHQEWGCASLGMHILTKNAHSLYRLINLALGAFRSNPF